MSRSNPSNGQNLRLGVVLVLASLAIGSTFVTSTSAETPEASTTTSTAVSTSAAVSAAPESSDAASDVASSASTVPGEPAGTTTSVGDTADAGDAGIDVVVVGDGDGDGPGLFVIDTGDDVNDTVEPADDIVGEDAEIEQVEACAPIVTEEVAQDDDAFFTDVFASDTGAWEPLAGRWDVADGVYRQSDASGFDLITQLKIDPPEAYRMSVTLQAVDGSGLGAGFVIGQPLPADRSGATVVDFTDGGRFLRWGRYDDDTAQYVYLGGVAMSESFDPSAAHELTVEVRSERTMVAVDGIEVGMFDPVSFGRVGLVTSQSTVLFDDLRIEAVGA